MKIRRARKPHACSWCTWPPTIHPQYWPIQPGVSYLAVTEFPNAYNGVVTPQRAAICMSCALNAGYWPEPPEPPKLDWCEECGDAPDYRSTPCCSSHGKVLCHRCYRRTHFVEICPCKECTAVTAS